MSNELTLGTDYKWEKNVLIGISELGIETINLVMKTSTWPFVQELCSWADDNPDSNHRVKFEFNSEVLVFDVAEIVLKRNVINLRRD